MQLKDTVALVTGGATGIGREICKELAQKGAWVAINYSRSADEAEETQKAIAAQGGRAFLVQADVSKEEQVLQMMATIKETCGRLDYLVNNAGTTRHIPMADLAAVTDEVWSHLLNTNLLSMFYCSRAAAELMQQHKGGSILNMGSVAGITGLGSSLPYAVSKSACHGLTRSLAHALAPHVRVNALAPGTVYTRWWQGREAQIDQNNPLQRMCYPEEIAAFACAVLLQPSLTGQIISPNNGMAI